MNSKCASTEENDFQDGVRDVQKVSNATLNSWMTDMSMYKIPLQKSVQDGRANIHRGSRNIPLPYCFRQVFNDKQVLLMSTINPAVLKTLQICVASRSPNDAFWSTYAEKHPKMNIETLNCYQCQDDGQQTPINDGRITIAQSRANHYTSSASLFFSSSGDKTHWEDFVSFTSHLFGATFPAMMEKEFCDRIACTNNVHGENEYLDGKTHRSWECYPSIHKIVPCHTDDDPPGFSFRTQDTFSKQRAENLRRVGQLDEYSHRVGYIMFLPLTNEGMVLRLLLRQDDSDFQNTTLTEHAVKIPFGCCILLRADVPYATGFGSIGTYYLTAIWITPATKWVEVTTESTYTTDSLEIKPAKYLNDYLNRIPRKYWHIYAPHLHYRPKAPSYLMRHFQETCHSTLYKSTTKDMMNYIGPKYDTLTESTTIINIPKEIQRSYGNTKGNWVWKESNDSKKKRKLLSTHNENSS